MEQELITTLLDIETRVRSLRLKVEGKLPELEGARQIHWGKKVSEQFKASVLWTEEQIGLNADDLMDCIAFETGATFSPSVKNLAGSSGLGLIQFMAATHKDLVAKHPQLRQLAPNHSDLAKLSAPQQLGFVYYYFKGFGSDFSNHSLEDVYMTILYPKAVGKPLDWVMPWKYGSLAYKQNSGLDADRDRVITKEEASVGVRKMAALGAQQKG